MNVLLFLMFIRLFEQTIGFFHIVPHNETQHYGSIYDTEKDTDKIVESLQPKLHHATFWFYLGIQQV